MFLPYFDKAFNYEFGYRMPPALTLDLVNLLHDYIVGERRSHIPPHLEVLIALRLFATESYQRIIRQHYLHPVSQTAVSYKCYCQRRK